MENSHRTTSLYIITGIKNNQTHLKVMIYTSKKYHSLEILHPWHNQQLKHLQTLVGEISNNTPIGILLVAAVEQLCLEIGLLGIFNDIPWEN